MTEIPNFSLFITASILLIIAPGQDVVYLITQSISRGFRIGLMSALGLSAGNIVHTVIVALGAAVIFQTSSLAFNLLKYAGALYLFYLAIKTLQHRNTPLNFDQPLKQNGRSFFKRGVLMNILNPKVSLFFLAFLPQFTNPQTGSVTIQLIFLGTCFVLMTAILFSTLAFMAASISHWIRNNPYAGSVLNWLSASVFIILGVRLLLMNQ